MNKFDWIFFDLDGTLADSIKIMNDVYFKFLAHFNLKGNIDEFNQLNGPSLNEIIIFLKNKYCLEPSIEQLYHTYEIFLEEVYSKKVKPMKGSTDLLKKLYKKKYNLALVSSSTTNIVKNFLNTNNWTQYFSVIVSGNEVKKSKPSPEIYDLCVTRANAIKKNVLVVEDSKKGYESATKAGLECILLNNKDINLDYVLLKC